MCQKVLRSAWLFVTVLCLIVSMGFCSDAKQKNETGIVATKRINKREVLDENVAVYLTQFGYMEKSQGGAFALRTEESVRDAIRELQQFAGIPVTGKIDERTLTLMKSPRCGVADRDKPNSRVKRYTIQGLKWPYTDLTWSLRTKYLPNLDSGAVRYVISKALAVWSKHSKLTFREVDSDQADIRIYFHRGDHGDNFPFDGRGVILAHAFFPTGQRVPVDVHFDADENWTTSASNDEGTNLFNVAAHEIGHSLGLSHSNEEGALMYPWYKEMDDGFDYELPQDDRLAIQYLYGTQDKQYDLIPQYNPVRTTTSTTTTTTRPTLRTYPTRPQNPVNPNNHYPYPPYKPSKNGGKNGKYPTHPDKKYPYGKRPHRPKYPETTTTPGRRYPVRHYPTKKRPEITTYPPKETPRKTNHYGNEEIPPDTCDTSYDAVSIIRRELYIFKDKYFWRIDDDGRILSGGPVKINRMFQGFSSDFTHVDAVYERPDGDIVFFIGKLYYVFSGRKIKPGYPQPITRLGLPRSLKQIDGAMVWGWNGRTYFFSGDMFWRFDEDEQKVELDYPRSLEQQWRGIQRDIDAVFQWKDGKTYFFKDRYFWKFHDHPMQVENSEPKLSAPFWMGCKNDYDNNIHQKLPYTRLENSALSPETSFVSIILKTLGVLVIRNMFLYL